MPIEGEKCLHNLKIVGNESDFHPQIEFVHHKECIFIFLRNPSKSLFYARFPSLKFDYYDLAFSAIFCDCLAQAIIGLSPTNPSF